MINETQVIHEPIHGSCTTHTFKRISWSAIFVGALVGVGLGFLLNLFGIAIGLSAVTVTQTGAVALAIGGVIGIIIAVIVSMFLSGYAAGYLGRLYCPKRNLGILYGFTTWSVALLLSASVASHMTHYASNYAHAMMGTSMVMTHSAQQGTNLYETGPTTAQSDMNKVSASKHGTVENKHMATNNITPREGLAYAAFLLFILFFIGAISTCIGACCAMSCHRED